MSVRAASGSSASRGRPQPRRAPGFQARTPRLKHTLLLALSALVLFLFGWAWLAVYPALPVDLGGAENLDARAERVTIPVPGGEHVVGWYLRGSEPAAVLLLHGYGRTHTRMWRYG